jgi:glycine cleavage system H protein
VHEDKLGAVRVPAKSPSVWVSRVSHGVYRLGCTGVTSINLGGIGFVDVPSDLGKIMLPGRPFAMIEGPKGMEQLVSPVSGEITEVNRSLVDKPSDVDVGQGDVGKAWIVEIDSFLEEDEPEIEFNSLNPVC